MSTIDSEEITRELMKNNGHFEDDPRVYQIEVALRNTGIKTVKEYTRLTCDNCKEFIFLSITESEKQVNDISENQWICPKCGCPCDIDLDYAYRMLAQ